MVRHRPRRPGRGAAPHGGAILLLVLAVFLAGAEPVAAQSPDPAPATSGPAPDPAPASATAQPATQAPATPALTPAPAAAQRTTQPVATPAPTAAPAAAPVTQAAPPAETRKTPARRPRRNRREVEKTPDPSPPTFDLSRPPAITEAAATLDTPAARAAALALLLAAAGSLALLTPLRRGLVP
jgi:outer membrane biosynthesis protein TonB